MKIMKLLVLAVFFLNFVSAPVAEAVCHNVVPQWNTYWCTAPQGYWGSGYEGWYIDYVPPPDYVTATCPYAQSGYTCTRTGNVTCGVGGGWSGYSCTKNNFTATQSGAFTLIGQSVANTVQTYNVQTWWEKPSPFIYLYNAPEGDISVTLDSQLDAYAPLPAFNQDNGWNLSVEDSVLSLNGEEVDHLFYELALNKISLTRNGRNFDSKEGLIEYLRDSDFLSRLGFSEKEKENSLGYIIPEIEESQDSAYYYLTVLEDTSIAEVSTLSVNPVPDKVVRQHFAVYPSAVPVATIGDFVFPAVEEVEGFTVKETGELLINSDMFVFFK